jgi:hypothetical protein
LNVYELFRGELGVVHVTRSDDTEGAKIIYLRFQVFENERQVIRVGVDLELYIRREGEVGRSAAELCCDGLVIPTCAGRERIRAVEGKVRYAWNDKYKRDRNAVREADVRHNKLDPCEAQEMG